MTPGFPKNSSSNQKKLCIDLAFQKKSFSNKKKKTTQRSTTATARSAG